MFFPGCTSQEILRNIQKNLQHKNIDPEKFEDRIIFMSMFNDIDLEQEQTMKENVFHVPKKSEITRRDSCKDIGRSLDQARKKNGMVNICPRAKGKWNSVAKHMHQTI